MTKKGGADMKKAEKKFAKDDGNKMKAKGGNSEKMEDDCIGCQHIYLLYQIKLSEVELERMCSG